jgi:hypothetical protein
MIEKAALTRRIREPAEHNGLVLLFKYALDAWEALWRF